MRRGSSADITGIALLAIALGCEESSTTEPRADCRGASVMAPTYPVGVEFLEARRAAVMQMIGTGAGYVTARPDGPDFEHGDSDFYYLTGLTGEDATLLMIPGESGTDQSILYVDPVPAGSGAVNAREITGVDEVRCLEDAQADLDSITAEGPPVFEIDARQQRMFKDAFEQERLRRAASVSVGGLIEGMSTVAPGVLESEVKIAVEAAFADSGAERTAFESIIASGSNTLELHYFEAADTIGAGDLIILDVGAEYDRYTGDVARTVPATGVFTARQRAVYGVVVAARQAVLDAFADGLGPLGARRAHEQVYADSAEVCGGTCPMPHLLFHAVGLDVHDVDITNGNVAGVVLNVEPGIYLSDEGFGMRTEDTVLLTGTGYVLLTDGLPTTADEIESFMAEQAALRASNNGD